METQKTPKPRKQRPRKDRWGNKQWFLNRKLHREDGPAIERSDGGEEWYLHGILHRVGGPAITYPNGSKVWYQDGKMHREDGPALEYSAPMYHFDNQWWYHGRQIWSVPNLVAFKVHVDRIKREEYADKYL